MYRGCCQSQSPPFPEYCIDLGPAVDPLPSNIDAYWNPGWNAYVRHYAKGLVQPRSRLWSVERCASKPRTSKPVSISAAVGTGPGRYWNSSGRTASVTSQTGEFLAGDEW